MKKHAFPQAMIDAVRSLKEKYETPSALSGSCPLCEVAFESMQNDGIPDGKRDSFCSLCPHAVIDGEKEKDIHTFCLHNPTVPSLSGTKGYALKEYSDEMIKEKRHTYKIGIFTIQQIAAQRQAHIERLNRWLSVMTPKEDEHGEA